MSNLREAESIVPKKEEGKEEGTVSKIGGVISAHPNIVLCILVLLILVIIYLYFKDVLNKPTKKKSKKMPIKDTSENEEKLDEIIEELNVKQTE